MKKYLVIGNPIKHSLSPLIHNYWIGKYHLADSVYEKREVEEKYRDWMKELEQYPHTDRIIHDYESIIHFMWEEDKTSLLTVFFDKVNQLDHIRSENFFETYKEFSKLKEYYYKNDFWKNRG